MPAAPKPEASTAALVRAYLAEVIADLRTGEVPEWDQGIHDAVDAATRALPAEGEPALADVEAAIAKAAPARGSEARRAGFLAAEGRIVGFLAGGAAATHALLAETKEA